MRNAVVQAKLDTFVLWLELQFRFRTATPVGNFTFSHGVRVSSWQKELAHTYSAPQRLYLCTYPWFLPSNGFFNFLCKNFSPETSVFFEFPKLGLFRFGLTEEQP